MSCHSCNTMQNSIDNFGFTDLGPVANLVYAGLCSNMGSLKYHQTSELIFGATASLSSSRFQNILFQPACIRCPCDQNMQLYEVAFTKNTYSTWAVEWSFTDSSSNIALPNDYNVKRWKTNFPVKIWCIYVCRNDTGLARLLQRCQRPPQGRPHGPGVVSETNI